MPTYTSIRFQLNKLHVLTFVYAHAMVWRPHACMRMAADDDKEVRRMAAELKDFDTLLAEREEEKRVEEWRKRKMGR